MWVGEGHGAPIGPPPGADPVAHYLDRLSANRVPVYVVTGPPNSGKTRWCASQARPGRDLVWDLDAVAQALTLLPQLPPRGPNGARPAWNWDVTRACLVMRAALVQWLAVDPMALGNKAYLIVTDEAEATRVARELRATLVRCGPPARDGASGPPGVADQDGGHGPGPSDDATGAPSQAGPGGTPPGGAGRGVP